MNIKTLMLGWEFPPYISGGLGTACHGLTEAMDRLGMQVTFVLPGMKPMRFVGGSDIARGVQRSAEPLPQEFPKSFPMSDSDRSPSVSPLMAGWALLLNPPDM